MCSAIDKHLVQMQTEESERALGVGLAWREMRGRKEARICLRQEGVDTTNRDQWASQHDWLIDTLEKFHSVFAPRVKALDASDYEPEEEAEA